MRPTFAAVWLFLLAGLSLACSPEAPPAARHLVLISVDTLRADRLGAYGHEIARTPAIDGLADEGIRFERALAHSSATLPSMASLLTGRLPAETDALNNVMTVADDLPTLAQRLASVDFAAAGFVGNWVLRRGCGTERGFDRYTEKFLTYETVRERPENPADVLTDEALAWIASRDPAERFFLWVHYQEPHGPYTPAEFDPGSYAEVKTVLEQSTSQSGRRAIPRYQWLGHGRLAEYLARYDAEIAIVDREIGRLLGWLRRRGLLETSVVVFVADHGEAFGEEELYCAHSEGLGEVLVRVPLILRISGEAPAVRHDAVRLIDVAPTVLELLGVPFEEDALPGSSLLRDAGDRVGVAQLEKPDGRRWRAVREGRFELREAEVESAPFRQLRRDGRIVEPGEAREVRARLEGFLDEYAPWPGVSAPTRPLDLPEEERDALRALGYVN